LTKRSFSQRARSSAALAVLLFAFWVLLSGHMDTFHLSAGAVVSIGIAVLSEPLLLSAPPITPPGTHPITSQVSLTFAGYVLWLAKEVVMANIQVARVVLHPTLPIDPQIVRVRYPLPHDLARLVLANSITLTPGTVTLDVEGDEYVVHSLTPSSQQGLAPDGIPKRVAAVFRSDTRGSDS